MVCCVRRCRAGVYCRTGSLESANPASRRRSGVYCRTGSLENYFPPALLRHVVYCRTGSLEKYLHRQPSDERVHRRTGSFATYDDGGNLDTLWHSQFLSISLKFNGKSDNYDRNQFLAQKSMLYLPRRFPTKITTGCVYVFQLPYSI